MTDVEYELLKSVLTDLVAFWKKTLRLETWEIRTVFERHGIPGDSTNYGASAFCHVNWEYMMATITFDMLDMGQKDINYQEEIVVHELMHVLVNEMRECYTCNCHERTFHIKHEERVCSMLALAFLTTHKFSQGASNG